MATSINTRLSDELEDKLNILIEDVKKVAPRGTEVTASSIMRGGLEKFVEEKEFEKKDIILVPIPLNEMSKETLIDIDLALRAISIELLKNYSKTELIKKADNYLHESISKISAKIREIEKIKVNKIY